MKPADIDLRAEVLKGIDQRLGHAEGMQTCSDCGPSWPLGACSVCATIYEARKALRHLREIVEMHKSIYNDPGHSIDETCLECDEDWPCPTLLSLAPDYAPQALAQMEADRG